MIRFFKLPPQLFRLVLLTFAIVVSYFVVRILLTPHSFRDYGFYRGAALAEHASHTPVFAGMLACDECHPETLEKLAEGPHKTLSCEGCHGVSQSHVDEPSIEPEIPADSRCIHCHEASPSRPAWFRQIEAEAGKHYPEQHCIKCHVSHQPKEIKEAP